MVRAAVTGAVDFAQYDPDDYRWWAGMWLRIRELQRQHEQAVAAARHSHWITLASHGNLEAASFQNALENANEALQQLSRAHYPWLDETAGAGSRDEAVEEFRKAWGYPGDPQYEAMVAHDLAVLRALDEPKEEPRRRVRKPRGADG